MSSTDVRRVVENNSQEAPSLVHVLSTLAAYWRLCECGLEIGRDGNDGWRQKCERLESELYPLQDKIECLEKLKNVTTDPRQLMQQETELAELQAELFLLSADIQAKEAPIEAEWEQAHNETEAYRELFWDAREFCVKACGIGEDEVFNAALVGFDPSQLKPGQEPSKQRMSEIVSLLRNLKRLEWETQPWADLPKPTILAARRVTPNRLKQFNVRNLIKSFVNPRLEQPSSQKEGEGKDNPVPKQGVSLRSAAEILAHRGGEGIGTTDEILRQLRKLSYKFQGIGVAQNNKSKPLYSISTMAKLIMKCGLADSVKAARLNLKTKLENCRDS
ncbi:MAG: hypothetical protein JNL58_04140 [Planctomyces sp.]|nr:hypothetical protein [Planctomyces sp.]